MNCCTGVVYGSTISGGGGGGGGMVVGQPVIGAGANKFLYTDASGNLFVDALAQRNDDTKHDSFIKSGTYAETSEDYGPGTDFVIRADYLGSNPSITFDGVSDTDTNVAAYNLANPTDTISVLIGGTNIPVAGTYVLLGGGESGLLTGELPIFNNTQGSGFFAEDLSINAYGFNAVGNFSSAFGSPSFGTMSAYYDPTGVISAFIANQNAAQIFSTDGISYQARAFFDSSGAYIGVNDKETGIDIGNDNFFIRNYSGINYLLPFSSGANLGDVLTVTNVSGSDYTMAFQPASGGGISNGTLPFQYWRWNDNAGTQGWDQVFILTETAISDQNVLVGDGAGVLTETSSAGYANTVVGTAAASSLSSVNSSEISRNVVVGANAADATLKMENSIVLGYQSLLGGTDQLIGSIIMTPDTAGSSSGNAINQNIALGYGTRIEGERNVVIGTVSFNSITSSATDNVSIGVASSSSLTNGQCNTSIGANSGSGLSTGDYNTFLGYGTSNAGGSSSHSIALGTQAQITANHELVIGGIAGSTPQGAIYNVKFNNGLTDANLEKYTIKFPDVLNTVTDADGPEVTFSSGKGTGTGNGSAFFFYASRPNSSSGTTSHATYQLLSIQNNDVTINRGLVYDGYAAYSVNHTILPEEHVLRFLGAAAPVDFTLPALSSVPAGKVYRIKDADGSAGSFTCRVVPDGTDTIDGATNYTFSSYEAIMLIADVANGNWEIY